MTFAKFCKVPAVSNAWKGSHFGFKDHGAHKGCHDDKGHSHGWSSWKTGHVGSKISPWHDKFEYCKPVNKAPVFTSVETFSVDENQTGVGTVLASDANGDTVRYSITGGDDAAVFDLDPISGVITFKDAPDFETPRDVGADNVYDIQIGASDGRVTTVQSVQVLVNDVDETVPVNNAPVFTAYTDFSRTGNQSVAIDSGTGRAGIRIGESGQIGFASAFDPDGDTFDFAIVGGLDGDRFTIDQTGALSVLSPLTLLGSADGDSVYEVILSVTDEGGASSQITLDYAMISAA